MRISDWSSDVCSSDLAAVAGLGLARVLLGLVAQLRDVGPAEHGVVVEGHLGVQRDHLAVLGDDQRVDLHHGRVEVAEGAVAAEDGLGRLRDLRRLEAEAAGDLARSEEHTSELQSLMRMSYAVFGWKKKNR